MRRKEMASPVWPVLKTYDARHLARVAMPIGGIGTGTVSLGGRGDLRDWEIVNRPAKGFSPGWSVRDVAPFFALYTEQDGVRVTRCLEGPIPEEAFEGSSGCSVRNHGLPRFRNSEFLAAYPLGQVLLSDPDVPLDVRLEAFNPLIPVDADASGIPVAVLRYVLTNRTRKPVRASVCGTAVNFIGADGSNADGRNWDGSSSFGGVLKENRNEYLHGGGLRGLVLRTGRPDTGLDQWGTVALATTARSGVSWRTAWAELSWGDTLLDFWDDFSSDGKLDPREQVKVADPKASLAVSVTVPPRGCRSVTFLLTWHFPNRRTWTPARKAEAGSGGCGEGCPDPDRIGNYYCTQYRDAWDAAVKTARRLGDLERRTVAFVRAFCDSDLPEVVKEAALFNLSTLRSQTCFRTEDGNFFGWEGCHDGSGCCHGSCTHVWNYEHATAFLFGDLACRARRVEFLHATGDDGHMSFRIHLPLARAHDWKVAAADGQMGTIMRLYREWQLSGDDGMLRTLWPRARKALEFCWVPGGWDADRDGVMEGCQHNTMDVEYYGPNPQMGSWYLGALRVAEEMARHVGETEFAGTCRGLFESGRRWTDANLFNGDYYEHVVIPPKNESAIAPGLRHETMGARNLADPELQLGAGCLVDQLVGQYMAHVCGLGYLLDPDHVRQALRSIRRHNFKEELFAHFNHLRSYALQAESAVLMATYPRGRRPKRPFPYYNEVMTGFEYTAAVGMLYEGMVSDGLRIVAAVRSRYDGRKRSPFDEAECGHHYARAMASWAAVPALSGFHYSGVTGRMEFAVMGGASRTTAHATGTRSTSCFWSNGYAWGTVEQRRAKGAIRLHVNVLGGRLRLRELAVAGIGAARFKAMRTIGAGRSVNVTVRGEG